MHADPVGLYEVLATLRAYIWREKSPVQKSLRTFAFAQASVLGSPALSGGKSVAIANLSEFIRENYEVHEWRHASAILATDFPAEWQQIQDLLTNFRVYRDWISEGGGSKTNLAGWIDQFLGSRGWVETKFNTQIKVDESTRDSPTHKVDCFKNRIALEVEWNNKDPFYDRDLNNFRLLFDLRVISVGVIFTRCDELQGLFDDLGRGKSYGNSTTHMSKLLPRIEGGGGGGCPLLVIGIKRSLFSEEPAPALPEKPKAKQSRAKRQPAADSELILGAKQV